jgi:hypothetical protein
MISLIDIFKGAYASQISPEQLYEAEQLDKIRISEGLVDEKSLEDLLCQMHGDVPPAEVVREHEAQFYDAMRQNNFPLSLEKGNELLEVYLKANTPSSKLVTLLGTLGTTASRLRRDEEAESHFIDLLRYAEKALKATQIQREIQNLEFEIVRAYSHLAQFAVHKNQHQEVIGYCGEMLNHVRALDNSGKDPFKLAEFRAYAYLQTAQARIELYNLRNIHPSGLGQYKVIFINDATEPYNCLRMAEQYFNMALRLSNNQNSRDRIENILFTILNDQVMIGKKIDDAKGLPVNNKKYHADYERMAELCWGLYNRRINSGLQTRRLRPILSVLVPITTDAKKKRLYDEMWRKIR